MLAGGVIELLGNGLHKPLTIPGEQLHSILGSLIGAKKAVFLIIAAAIDRRGEKLVQRIDLLRTGGQQAALGALAGMDVAVDDVLRIGQDGLGVIGKHHLHLGAAVPNQVHVIGHIVHTSEGVHGVAEQLPVLLQRQHIPVGVHALLVHEVRVNKMVAYLIRGVAEHKDDLLCALGNAPQADGKAVAAEDGENDTHGLTAQPPAVRQPPEQTG